MGIQAKAEQVVSALLERGLSLSAAESCTGGLFSATLVGVPGASAVFLGGVVSYASEIKERILSVPHALIEAHTAVSRPVARAMAEGACRLTRSDIAISVTGLAGPGGGTPEIPVGRVYVGVCRAEKELLVHELDLAGTREEIRTSAVDAMLDILLNLLHKQEELS